MSEEAKVVIAVLVSGLLFLAGVFVTEERAMDCRAKAFSECVTARGDDCAVLVKTVCR